MSQCSVCTYQLGHVWINKYYIINKGIQIIILVLMIYLIDFILFHVLSQESASLYFKWGSFLLMSSCWYPAYPTTHRGAVEKDGAKIPKGGNWQNVLRPQPAFGISLNFFNSVEMAAPFNVVSHSQDTACYLDRITQILRFRVR